MSKVSKVTLLGTPGSTYTIAYGAREYLFAAGRARKVPVVIALEAQKKRDRRGAPLFSVEDLPEIVTSAPPEPADPVEEPEQNAPAEAQQPTFGI
jgi:hypothetical protein